MAVSGQLKLVDTENRTPIIPRGFGGIRTTGELVTYTSTWIIPRGFGGIRTTCFSIRLNLETIIPRGFGGIRTTEQPLSRRP